MLSLLRAIGPGRLVVLAGISVALIIFLGFLANRIMQPPMGLLYSGLDLQDSGQIVAKLDGMKIPYELRAGGQQIFVPEDQALRLRIAMAQSGLPTGGSVGYEIFDRGDQLGATNFTQSINHLRALEGEIARTIRSIDQVAAVRVHLVLPKREIFSREQREPSASIVLKLRGTGRLERGQVQAIQNLVAAAVPDLKASRVAIIDDKGTLLARGSDERDDSSASIANVGEIRRNIEEKLRHTIETLLERSLGPGNVRAEVTADVDFDRVVTNQESFDPEGQVVRSTQTTNETNNSTEQDGNTTVSVANNLPDSRGQQNGGSKSSSNGGRTEETINYEISKTVRTQTREGGAIKRLSVAVLVDGVRTAKDGAREYAPRSEAEIAQITALVRSAIGFDSKRGDTLEVINMPFVTPEETKITAEEPPLLGLDKSDLFRLGERGLLGLLGLIALLVVARPIVNRLLAGSKSSGTAARALVEDKSAINPDLPPGTAMTALGDGQPVANAPPMLPKISHTEQMIDLAQVEGQVKASSIKKIGEIVSDHPDRAVAIMRGWMYQEA